MTREEQAMEGLRFDIAASLRRLQEMKEDKDGSGRLEWVRQAHIGGCIDSTEYLLEHGDHSDKCRGFKTKAWWRFWG